MQAVAVSEYGASPALVEIPDPQPGPGQVLIKVRAAGINPMDRSIASGAYTADTNALDAAGVTGINFAVSMTPELLARLADAVVSGRYAAPPITTVRLTDVPGLLSRAGSGANGKTVILVGE